jgi:hypothetical protein
VPDEDDDPRWLHRQERRCKRNTGRS